MFIILHKTYNFNTSRAKSDADALFRFRSFYFRLTNSIDLSSIECSCGSHCWSHHCYYRRYYTFMGRRIRVKILRIICSKCGKTHALLIEEMIPYSTLTYDEILNGISDDYTTDDTHHQYLIKKYKKHIEYKAMCMMNRRNWTLGFIST